MKTTFITAVYNRQATIGPTIDSLAAQDYVDVEHLIIDGASTDGTLKAIGARHFPRMHVVREPDRGVYDALNKVTAPTTAR